MNAREPTLVRGHEGPRYPIVVVSIDAESGSSIHKFQPLFTFKFNGTAVESQDDGQERVVPRIFIERFDSPVDGTDCQWFVSEGETIYDTSYELHERFRGELMFVRTVIFSVVEPCRHEIQYAGMCASCGKDLTRGDYLGNADSDRATVAMSHDTLGLTVSYSEAARLERETTKRLVQTSKLSLIVDLDQCVIQTTVDPTVGEWLGDEDNPNFDALRDVQQFQIAEEGIGAPTYYVKPRPGLQSFLQAISKKYEMHIYTMGTKPYARKIAAVIDPDGHFFGNRILSRDENGSNTQKSVQRLFPVETNMVVIIDDRGDVWQWSPNLIKVNPFEFFVGIGDINSSFLPKIEAKPLPAQTNSSLGTTKLLPDASLMESVEAPELVAAQTASLEAQVEERPLAKQQEALSFDATSTALEDRAILQNGDNELFYLERSLRKLHEEFYITYNARIGEVTKERNLEKLDRNRSSKRNLNIVADVKVILSQLKKAVLKGVVIMFSGLIRSDLDPRREWQGQLAIQFGARVLDSRSKETPTHVVVGRDITSSNLTEKARMAKSQPWIKVVYLKWLLDSVTRFERLHEQEYQVDKNAPHVEPPASVGFAMDDYPSDAESVTTDNGLTDRFIDEAAKTMNWKDLEGEMDDYLGELSDDATTEASDNDSDSSKKSTASSKQKKVPFTARHKRMRSIEPAHCLQKDQSNNDLLRSPLSKRRNIAKHRKSGLAQTFHVSSDVGEVIKTGGMSPKKENGRRSALGEDDHGSVASDLSSDLDELANELELQLEG